MQELDHVNILKLVDVFAKKANVSLVIELCSTDLEVLLRDKSVQLVPADVKSFLLMSFQGLEYLHNNWILHRVSTPERSTHFFLAGALEVTLARSCMPRCASDLSSMLIGIGSLMCHLQPART